VKKTSQIEFKFFNLEAAGAAEQKTNIPSELRYDEKCKSLLLFISSKSLQEVLEYTREMQL
jgi:hypothetical protein